MIIECSKCGRKIDDGMKFCQYCGNQISRPAISAGEIAIPNQNSSENVNSKPIINYNVTPKEESMSGYSNVQKNASSDKTQIIKYLLITVIVIVLCCTGVICLKIMKDNSNSNDESNRSVAQTTTTEAATTETSTQAKNTTEVKNETTKDNLSTNSYFTYENSRFGYSMIIPKSFSQVGDLPTNGDGLEYKDMNGARLLVSGSYNVLGDTPQSFVESSTKAEYSHVGDNYCCISYYDDSGNIVYAATYIDNSLECGFVLTYSSYDKDKYDSIITDMVKYISSGKIVGQ